MPQPSPLHLGLLLADADLGTPFLDEGTNLDPEGTPVKKTPGHRGDAGAAPFGRTRRR